MIVVLSGGFGGARFLRGLARVVPPAEITVVGNTGDDIDVYGVHVSPDLDIVTFMLAGVLDEARQFGIAGDSNAVMNELRAQGLDAWFSLGDRDFAVCAARTIWRQGGATASECAARIARRFGVDSRILPMSDDPVQTRILARMPGRGEADLHFQEWWVRERAAPSPIAVRLDGADRARPAPGVLEAIAGAEAVVVAPSNPVVSIGTILAVPGIREALRRTRAPVVAVSPIIDGAVVRGMADRLMPVEGIEVSARGVAQAYGDFADAFVLDEADAEQARDVERIGLRAAVTHSLMRTPEDAAALAKRTLELAQEARA